MKTVPVPRLLKNPSPEPMLEHTIRLRAYELYAQRGMAEGHAVQDWLQAESRAAVQPLATLQLRHLYKELDG
jgi:hypothetical protein